MSYQNVVESYNSTIPFVVNGQCFRLSLQDIHLRAYNSIVADLANNFCRGVPDDHIFKSEEGLFFIGLEVDPVLFSHIADYIRWGSFNTSKITLQELGDLIRQADNWQMDTFVDELTTIIQDFHVQQVEQEKKMEEKAELLNETRELKEVVNDLHLEIETKETYLKNLIEKIREKSQQIHELGAQEESLQKALVEMRKEKEEGTENLIQMRQCMPKIEVDKLRMYIKEFKDLKQTLTENVECDQAIVKEVVDLLAEECLEKSEMEEKMNESITVLQEMIENVEERAMNENKARWSKLGSKVKQLVREEVQQVLAENNTSNSENGDNSQDIEEPMEPEFPEEYGLFERFRSSLFLRVILHILFASLVLLGFLKYMNHPRNISSRVLIVEFDTVGDNVLKFAGTSGYLVYDRLSLYEYNITDFSSKSLINEDGFVYEGIEADGTDQVFALLDNDLTLSKKNMAILFRHLNSNFAEYFNFAKARTEEEMSSF